MKANTIQFRPTLTGVRSLRARNTEEVYVALHLHYESELSVDIPASMPIPVHDLLLKTILCCAIRKLF
jgi:hypothetical protein